MTAPHVPFCDLYAQYLSIKSSIDAAIANVIKTSAFIRGPYVDRFEQDFAKAVGSPHCISCANGTDALYIALRALKVQPGDEVLTTAHSWISTSETITQSGAKVVFCDTERDTFTIDPADVARKITPRTVGILPVHLFGQAADMDAILEIAKKHKLWVVEDCAQAHLARYKGKRVGTFGTVAAFSFYPGKNLGAMGDGGAIVTSDRELSLEMTKFARHGGLKKGDHEIEGINSRLDGLQAAILSVKLEQLPEWTRLRQAAAAVYDQRLAGIPGIDVPVRGTGREHVYHLYAIRSGERDRLARFLESRGVQTVINYPRALPFLPAYARLGHRPEDFPNAYHNQSRVLSLPIFAEITGDQQAAVVAAIREFVA